MEFKLNLSLKELRKRTSKKYYSKIEFLSSKSKELKKLSNEDLLVLTHLVRAGYQFEKINLKLENHKNLEFLEYLGSQIELGDEKAKLTKMLFSSQKSMFSPDTLGNRIMLAKNVEQNIGLGYYPEDLTVPEFHKILNNMLDIGLVDEVKKILSQRTVVVRNGEILKAIDYVDYFPEFKIVANELRLAKEYSTDTKFCEFLEAQAQALETADPLLDAKADKIWATLEDTKFEFTITRECYEEQMTNSILENEKLASRLNSLGIEIITKDSLGARVGIINKSGTKFLNKLKNLTKIQSRYMPYKDEYKTSVNVDVIPQTAVDVDLVALYGEEGAYRAGIVLAQNLPNDDKLSLKIGGGRRNVYHRQIRLKDNKKLYKNLITESQFCYYNLEADHWATICHENTHSLGPDAGNSLGKYSSILEEYKADMGMYAFLDEFVENGFFTEKQAKQIMVTSLSSSFLKGKPTLNEPHKTRSCMIVNRMISTGGITFDDTGKLVFNFEKIKETTKIMMQEVIKIQLDGNINNARTYVEKWFEWTDEIERVAEIIKKYSKKLNGYLEMPLAKDMLNANFENEILNNI